MEAHFRNSSITADQTKYDCIVSSIVSEILSQVSDILINLTMEGKYAAVKNRLIIFIVTETKTQKIKTILTEVKLSDRKPSQLLCETKNLPSDKVGETPWLQRLPSAISSILSISGDDSALLTTMADKIYRN